MTVSYALSGVAVNHVDDWNPSYSIERGSVAVGALPEGLDAQQAHVARALSLEDAEVRGRHASGPDELTLFLREGGEVKVAVSTGRGVIKRVSRRAGVFEVNVLHLNHIKGAWTWVADIFALLLVFLALSGLFMLRGRKGLAGRGKWFVAGGALVPVIAIVSYYMSL